MIRLSLPSPLGPLVVSEDNGSIVALDWDTETYRGNSDLLHDARRQLDAYFAGELRVFDLPFDPAGNDFQKSVWRRMCEIPYGETETYGETARRLNSAARAVGTACGRNPIPILIPCHRIVGSGGALTGYSGQGGIETKRFLLSLEGNMPDLFAG